MSTTDHEHDRRSRSCPATISTPTPGGGGWMLFAGVMLALIATLNVIEGIAAISNSTFFVQDAKFVVSGLNTWGWVILVIGVTQG